MVLVCFAVKFGTEILLHDKVAYGEDETYSIVHVF